jgi:hypothetical protein
MKADALSELIVEIFRINGRLLAAGDRLVADLGLTSARWQVIGAIALAGQPQTVPAIARTMGLTRGPIPATAARTCSPWQAAAKLRSPMLRRARRPGPKPWRPGFPPRRSRRRRLCCADFATA